MRISTVLKIAINTENLLTILTTRMLFLESGSEERNNIRSEWPDGVVFGGRLSDAVERAVLCDTAGAVVGTSKSQEQAAREQTQMARPDILAHFPASKLPAA